MSGVAASFLAWLLRTSWQAAVLVGVLMLVQWLFRKRLSPRWRYAFWFLVLIRLALPAAPPSALSLFNYAGIEKRTPVMESPAAAETSTIESTADLGALRPLAKSGRDADSLIPGEGEVFGDGISPAPIPISGGASSASPQFRAIKRARSPWIANLGPRIDTELNLTAVCAWVWLAGFILLTVRILGQNVLFLGRLRTADRISDPDILALLDQCKEVMGVRIDIPLAETSHVSSPALYGLFHPKLLLPARMTQQFGIAELRYIFLHELAHLKRRDMVVLWKVTFLQALHWFNPVLWFGFRCMAADREMACDELALARAGGLERRPYGETIIKLLEICSQPSAIPGVIGILEDKTQMRRRITMIARFQRPRRWSALAAFLLLAIGLLTLTDAQTNSKPSSKNPPVGVNPTSGGASSREPPLSKHPPVPVTDSNTPTRPADSINLAANADTLRSLEKRRIDAQIACYDRSNTLAILTSMRATNYALFEQALPTILGGKTDPALPALDARVARARGQVAAARTTVGPYSPTYQTALANWEQATNDYHAKIEGIMAALSLSVANEKHTLDLLDDEISRIRGSSATRSSALPSPTTNTSPASPASPRNPSQSNSTSPPPAPKPINALKLKSDVITFSTGDEARANMRADLAALFSSNTIIYRKKSAGVPVTDWQDRLEAPSVKVLGQMQASHPDSADWNANDQPWSGIEGILRNGSQPVTNGYVVMEMVAEDVVEAWRQGIDLKKKTYRTATDGSGRFGFDLIPPGEFRISCELGENYNNRPQRWHFPTHIRTEAGKTTEVELDISLDLPRSQSNSLATPIGTGLAH